MYNTFHLIHAQINFEFERVQFFNTPCRPFIRGGDAQGVPPQKGYPLKASASAACSNLCSNLSVLTPQRAQESQCV